MSGLVNEDVQDASGPNASLDFGQVSQQQALANSLKSANPGAYAASRVPDPRYGGQFGGGQPGMPGAPGGAPPAMGQPPVQPAPQQPGRLDLSQVFSTPIQKMLQGETPWRARARDVWPNHPEAGPALKRLGETLASQRGPTDAKAASTRQRGPAPQ